jgi:hypothetical protein
MLDKKDLQAVGELLDKKLKKNNKALRDEMKENNKTLKDEIVAEIGGAVNAGFNAMQANFNELKEDVEILKIQMSKRPTKKEIRLGPDLANARLYHHPRDVEPEARAFGVNERDVRAAGEFF